jgi:septum formation protein
MSLILASSSPRRKQLLRQLGYQFDQHSVEVDESVLDGEAVDEYLMRVSLLKAHAVASVLDNLKKSVILACDTVVCCDDTLFQKPENELHFKQMMQRLSGRQHTVKSGLTVMQDKKIQQIICQTQVQFRLLSMAEIEAYWQTKEPLDKAGGYAIQRIGAGFVTSIKGSYSNVVGLPLTQTIELLRCFNIDYLES